MVTYRRNRHLQKQLAQLRAGQHGISLPKPEVDLLVRINRVATPPSDERYQELLVKCKTETLSRAEHQAFITLSDKYEQQNAELVKLLSQLAQLRGVSLSELMNQLTLS